MKNLIWINKKKLKNTKNQENKKMKNNQNKLSKIKKFKVYFKQLNIFNEWRIWINIKYQNNNNEIF